MINQKVIFDDVVRHIMTAADEDFAGLSVSSLAYLFHIDRYKLLRQFKEKTNMTIETFIFKEKMTRAAFLLESDESITTKEVSKRIGFCTSNYFIKKFREYYGIVPGRYKKIKAERYPERNHVKNHHQPLPESFQRLGTIQ